MFSCYVSFREVIVLDDILHVTCSQVEGAADDVRYSVFHKNGGPVKFRGLTTQNGPSFTVPKFNKRNILGMDIFSKKCVHDFYLHLQGTIHNTWYVYKN